MNAIVPVNAAPAMTVSDVEKVAGAIARGGLFGSKDPYAVLTLCLLAQAEGQHPAVVFRDYHIISGKPAKKAEAMLRDFINAGGKIEWHALTDEIADATFSHPSGGSARISWDHKRAVQAQLAGNAMYKKYPRQMLRSRTISEGVRTIYPGATSGLYVPEEVSTFEPAHEPEQSGAQIAQTADIPAEPETAPARKAKAKDDPFPQGPGKNKTDLKAKGRDFWREVEGCGDGDELDALLAANTELTAQLAKALPSWWEGGTDASGEPFEGLSEVITRKQRDFAAAQLTSDYVNAG